MRSLASALLALAGLFALPGTVQAGMPNPVRLLNEIARLRVHSISFFLVVFFLSAWLIQALWNFLRRDFSILPRLSYLRAVGLVVLWGLLFILVLTMISGARELMTPGAWQPKGVTYRLNQKETPGDDPLDQRARREQLARLKEALWAYAKDHSGQFPSSQSETAIAPQLWVLPNASGMRYVYFGGTATLFDGVPLACEPEIYGRDRWTLLTNGVLRKLTSEEISRQPTTEKK
jgi:hypothetical protein